MHLHPFQVWLAYNANRDRQTRQCLLAFQRTVWPLDPEVRSWNLSKLTEHVLSDMRDEQERQELAEIIDCTFGQYQIWAAGCRADWIDVRQQWKTRK